MYLKNTCRKGSLFLLTIEIIYVSRKTTAMKSGILNPAAKQNKPFFLNSHHLDVVCRGTEISKKNSKCGIE